MKVTKVHRILKLKQPDWLKIYIIFNTDKGKDAANSFEKGFSKLINNSNFGKIMENLRIRMSVKLVNKAKDYVRYISKPSFVSQKIFSKNFVSNHEIKQVLTLNQPIYVGLSILDLKNNLMYEFHYKYIKSKFDPYLLFTDANSLVYEIKTEDVYEDFYEDKKLFDFSDYSLSSKVIGKIKDEFKRKIISEFEGLKSKMFSLIAVDSEEVKKGKKVNKNVGKKSEIVNALFHIIK